MTTPQPLNLTPRAFTRREKTILRQDVKRFQKIGRDHGVITFEDYAYFVTDRMKRDGFGQLTENSLALLRGFISYFGEELMHETTLARLATDLTVTQSAAQEVQQHWNSVPGRLLVNRFVGQQVLVAGVIQDRVFGTAPWPMPLDEIFDQIVDWNQGYLIKDEVETRWVIGNDIEPEDYLAA